MDVDALVEKAGPGDAAELATTLNNTPRKNLQAIGKELGVDSAQAKEALVGGITRALNEKAAAKSDSTDAQMEEAAEAEQGDGTATDSDAKPEEADKDEAESKQSASLDAATPSKRDEEPETEISASTDDTPQPKPIKRAAARSVGKSGVKGQSTPAKRTPVAKMPSGSKVSSNSKKFDVIHANQIAKEPTIYEHDKAKKAKVDSMLQSQSVTRATRSSARKIVSAKAKDEPIGPVAKKIVFKAGRNHVSILDRPTISSSLKRAETKQATKDKAGPARKATQSKAAPFTSTVTAGPRMSAPATSAAAKSSGAKPAEDGKPKRTLNYKPYTGPLPKYKEDPIFSPVNKEKIEIARIVHTPAKKGKENLKPTPSKSTAGRTPIKKATSSTQVTAKAKDDRRAKFAHESKTNATAARQSPRRAVNASKA